MSTGSGKRSSDAETGIALSFWQNKNFRDLLNSNPWDALKTIGIEIPAGVKLRVVAQRPDTLYYLIPPRYEGDPADYAVPNQVDLWRSGDMFTWIVPERLKVELLSIRRQYREFAARASLKNDGNDGSAHE